MESSKSRPTEGQAKREKLFDYFSKNLATVKRHPKLHITPEFEDGVICPMCFKLFTREGLSSDYDDRLTLEDVPPIALGGQPLLLTCKVCNNKAGSQLDAHLTRMLEMEEFLLGIPGVKIRTKFRPAPGIQLPATTRFAQDGSIDIRYLPKRSHPDQIRLLNELAQNGKINNISLDFLPGHKINRSEIALIRIAYLLAFAKFGYGFLINPAIHWVRQQIQSPADKLLPDWGIMPGTFPDEALGVSILYQPTELRGFLVVFDLQTAIRSTRYGILLPGPTSPSGCIYQNLADLRSNPEVKNITYSIHGLPNLDYLGNPELAFASHELWKNLS